MSKHLIIFLLFIIQLSIFAETAGIDSLEMQLVGKSTNTDKLHFINNRAFRIKYSNTQLAKQYLEYGLRNYSSHVHDTILAESYKYSSICDIILGENTSAEKNVEKALSLYDKYPNQYNIGYCYNIIGIINGEIGNFEKAINYYIKCSKIYEDLGLYEELSNPLSNIGSLYYKSAKYDLALECYFKVLSIKSKAHEKEGMSISFSNIGISYKAKGDLDSAMLYYNKALVMYIELHDFKGQSHTMSTLGNLHLKKENFSKAKKYFSGALDIQIEQGDLGGQMFTHLGLASLSNARKEIDQGLHHAKLGLKISRGIGVVCPAVK